MVADVACVSGVGGGMQVACILSEAEVVDGMLDYWKFVPVAAKILQVRAG